MTMNTPAVALHAGLRTDLRDRIQNAAPPLYRVGLAMLLMSIPTFALTFIDTRQLQGVSVWLKPFKFQFSSGVYLLTLALCMVWLPVAALRSLTARYVVWAAVMSAVFEVGYISWQGSLGLASHFNTQTPFFAAMYTLMGIGAAVLTSAALVLAILIARNPSYGLPPAITLAIVLGLGLTFFLGAGFGGYLGGQRAGHWVGGALTDSGGLPLFTWSRSGGDLRVAHFFGIHAMHFIPAFALVLGWARVPQAAAIRAVWIFAIAFASFCTWTFVQALSGIPFLA